MSEPFIGEIRLFAGNFAPRGWAFCDGQVLSISQNTALFSLLGTTYGGDGRTTFSLPDLRGRIPIHEGTGPGLTPQRLGAKGGAERVVLSLAQMPAHGHQLSASSQKNDARTPSSETSLGSSSAEIPYHQGDGSVAMSTESIKATGGNQAHENIPPFLCINYLIALIGIFPSRP